MKNGTSESIWEPEAVNALLSIDQEHRRDLALVNTLAMAIEGEEERVLIAPI